MRILVVEDERKLAAAIAEGLQGEGYEAAIAHSGEAALKCLYGGAFDLMLLDVMLPRKSGMETLREARRAGFKLPVLILTSRDAVEDRVPGLDAGGDDSMAKPFAFPELPARIRALIRRGHPGAVSYRRLADLRIDLNGRTAVRAGQVELRKTVFPLIDLAREVVGIAGVPAEEKRQTVRLEGGAWIQVEADRMIVQRALLNLVDNAVKYSPEGGNIFLRVAYAACRGADPSSMAEDGAEPAIEDEGPGIPEEARSRVFDRFYRVDAARRAAGSLQGDRV